MGESERMVQRWPFHYKRPRATSGIHGVASIVRYGLRQYRGIGSPCQVADALGGTLENNCFNILTKVHVFGPYHKKIRSVCLGSCVRHYEESLNSARLCGNWLKYGVTGPLAVSFPMLRLSGT